MSEQRKMLTGLAVTALALNSTRFSRSVDMTNCKEEKSRFIARKTKDFIEAGHSKVTARVMAKKEWRENRDE